MYYIIYGVPVVEESVVRQSHDLVHTYISITISISIHLSLYIYMLISVPVVEECVVWHSQDLVCLSEAVPGAVVFGRDLDLKKTDT